MAAETTARLKGYQESEILQPFSESFNHPAVYLTGRRVSPHIETAVGVESAIMIPLIIGLAGYPTGFVDTLKAIIALNIHQVLAKADSRHIYTLRAVVYIGDMANENDLQMITTASEHLSTVGSQIDSFVNLIVYNILSPSPESLRKQGGGSESFLSKRPAAMPFLLRVSIRP